MDNINFRFAEEQDCDLILSFIKALAIYEKLEDQITATPELLHYWLFVEKRAEVFFAVSEGKEVGFALFFYNFSTFLGRAGVYLEDLFVLPEHRGKGIGKAIMRKLASIAVERNCGRFEWNCLDWNTPSIEFYRSLGAERMEEWTLYRLSGNALTSLAEEKI